MTADSVRLNAEWCSCLVRVVDDLAVVIVESCWAHNRPFGFLPGDRRDYEEGSPLDMAIQDALEEASR